MKKLLFGLFFISFLATGQNLYNELNDGSSGIVNDYGAWGTYNNITEPEIEVTDKGTITFYHPDMAISQRPVIFFISGWGQPATTYEKFFKYLTSLGYSVVNIYNLSPGSINTSYPNSLSMMQQAVQQFSGWIDTTRVGLMGHSYGGGSTIWLGKQVFDEQGLNWGTNGRLIMTFTPWLSFLVTDTDLQNYPPNVKLLMLQSFDDLHYNGPTYNTDPRALRAVYQLINIPDDEKDFITIFSDNDPAHAYTYQGNTYTYKADHYTCYTGINNGQGYQAYDALDVYSSNRLAHALTKYVFYGDMTAKNIALGNNSPEQKDMGIMPDLGVTDYYITQRPESAYEYKCSEDAPGTWGSTDIWHLQNYCIDADNDGHIDTLNNLAEMQKNGIKIYPNPFSNQINIIAKTNEPFQINVYNVQGQVMCKQSTRTIHTATWPKGIYFVQIELNGKQFVQKIIK